MAKREKQSKREFREKQAVKAVVPETPIGFTRKNYILFGLGLGMIAVGFLFLTSPVFGGAFPFVHPFKAGTYGFLTMNVAPVLLVLGYCLVIPASIVIK
jgi:hypothetical protein